ncbi:hypothetical protein DID80_02175 [Candidatus Marinamargulisbacteria bacterium SCGC AAA071-K20]|nr:hypothetical protein DID80_02175 [Candidatus Marinamargulisbacteria bacterium SCGC AAA071-K20]
MARQPTLAYIVATNLEHPGLALKFEGQVEGFSKYFRTQFINYQFKGTDGLILKTIKYIIFELMVLFAFMGNNRIYIRYDPKAILTNFFSMLFSPFKPVYFEHNGIFEISLKKLNRSSEIKLHGISLSLLKFFPATHIGVTKEIQSYLIEQGMKKTLYIQNGYQFPSTPPSTPKALKDTILELKKKYKSVGVFVGNGYIWHGIDDIFSLFRGRSDCALIVVGKGYENNKKEDNILMTGPLGSSDLSGVFEFCDFGVSMFDSNMKGLTSPLKTREYLCNGLPILVNFYDNAADFEKIRPFIFSYYKDNKAFENILKHDFKRVDVSKRSLECFNWSTLLSSIV